jgi:hypothetical protein
MDQPSKKNTKKFEENNSEKNFSNLNYDSNKVKYDSDVDKDDLEVIDEELAHISYVDYPENNNFELKDEVEIEDEDVRMTQSDIGPETRD